MGFYDKCIKKLCVSCPRLMVLATNSIFHKEYDENAEVVFLDKEQITDVDEEASYMDMLFSIDENDYHWEFQLLEDKMAIRMYEYGIKETLKQVHNTKKASPQYELYVRMPQQAVIFLAGCKQDFIKVVLRLPDEQEVSYLLPCIDASNPVQTLVERKLYLLLPFQQVQMNSRMNNLREALIQTKKEVAVELHEYYKIVRNTLENLEVDGILTERELEAIYETLADIEIYLSDKDVTVRKEVEVMGDNDYVSYSERLIINREEGREEGKIRTQLTFICKKLAKGMTDEEIADLLEEELTTIQPMCELARGFAPNYDVDEIYKMYVKK